jgi:hypothetical protein
MSGYPLANYALDPIRGVLLVDLFSNAHLGRQQSDLFDLSLNGPQASLLLCGNRLVNTSDYQIAASLSSLHVAERESIIFGRTSSVM